ncbi:hypothetical protein J437_LFUL019031 [Ladona fulva]|uniref:USP domain-containing protein n=1 Tax=Ladona fulva TaxID=123851 RepID=A0A8K0KQP7_LADFU|nr:hypothetical protein J437_LFUL019031 [Ladona fulva]
MASVKENDPVSAYLKCHILNRKPFQSSATNCDNDTTIESCVAVSGRRILENEVKFEKVTAYSAAVSDKLKGKYKLLAAHKKIFVESSDAQPNSLCGLSPKKSLDMGISNKISSEGLPSPSTQLYPESAIKLGWQGNEPVGAGMLNLGNTCYLNSTLQALFHVPSFCNWLSSQAVHNGRGKCDQAC